VDRTTYCNGEKAVKEVTRKSCKGITDYLVSDSDVLHEAKQLYNGMSMAISLLWIEGHSSWDYLSNTQDLNQYAHDLEYKYLKCPDSSFSPSDSDRPTF
jgi:hypothetical protein